MLRILWQPNISYMRAARPAQPYRRPGGRSGDARRLRLGSVSGKGTSAWRTKRRSQPISTMSAS